MKQDYPEPRSFVNNRGPRLSARQKHLLANKGETLTLDLNQPSPEPLVNLFEETSRSVCLEIGFGGGEHLIARLQQDTEPLWLGCEAYKAGVAKLLAGLDDRLQDRLRLHQGDARDLLEWLPNASLDAVYLLYPDPWPKARHHKRRFISNPNLDRLARALKPNGRFHFATDSADYADWCLRFVRGHTAFSWPAKRPQDWLQAFPNWPGTRYEAKALAAKRTPTYLTFIRS